MQSRRRGGRSYFFLLAFFAFPFALGFSSSSSCASSWSPSPSSSTSEPGSSPFDLEICNGGVIDPQHWLRTGSEG